MQACTALVDGVGLGGGGGDGLDQADEGRVGRERHTAARGQRRGLRRGRRLATARQVGDRRGRRARADEGGDVGEAVRLVRGSGHLYGVIGRLVIEVFRPPALNFRKARSSASRSGLQLELDGGDGRQLCGGADLLHVLDTGRAQLEMCSMRSASSAESAPSR